MFIKIHAFSLFTILAFITSVNAQQSSPNILIILADDLGYGDVSFNGCPDYATPNIDSIARNGALCKNGYVMYPLCSPSRAALMTGRYEQRFGFERQLLPAVGNPRLGLPNPDISLRLSRVRQCHSLTVTRHNLSFFTLPITPCTALTTGRHNSTWIGFKTSPTPLAASMPPWFSPWTMASAGCCKRCRRIIYLTIHLSSS